MLLFTKGDTEFSVFTAGIAVKMSNFKPLGLKLGLENLTNHFGITPTRVLIK